MNLSWEFLHYRHITCPLFFTISASTAIDAIIWYYYVDIFMQSVPITAKFWLRFSVVERVLDTTLCLLLTWNSCVVFIRHFQFVYSKHDQHDIIKVMLNTNNPNPSLSSLHSMFYYFIIRHQLFCNGESGSFFLRINERCMIKGGYWSDRSSTCRTGTAYHSSTPVFTTDV